MVVVGAGRSFMSVLACALLVWGVLLICAKCEGALVGPFESHFVEFGGVPFIAALAD